ncbi:MAG: histidine kinase [Eubacteriales bacterium]|nr:histidine kinase [Eubacteriales bacterium]
MCGNLQKGSIFNRVLFLIAAVIILPMILIYSLVSSFLIGTLHENYNDAVVLSAYMASQAVKDAVGSVIDVSISMIGDIRVREYLKCLERPDNYYEIYASAQSALENYCQGNNYIAGILVEAVDGSGRIRVGTGQYGFSEEEKERMLASNGAWFWHVEEDGKTAVCRLMRNTDNVKEQLGFIKILMDAESVEKQFAAGQERNRYAYALVDAGEEEIVLATEEGAQEEIRKLFSGERSSKRNGTYYSSTAQKKYLVYTEMTINTRPVYLVVAAEDQTFYYALMKYGIVLLLVLLFFVFYIFYAVFYRKSIGAPLTALSWQMQQSKAASGAPEQIAIEAEGEVKVLLDSFNAMSARLDDLYETNYKNELKLRDANLLILQSEMNPHFLYNVLDSCRWMIELGEKEAASGMVQKLSEMFRLSLSMAEQSVVGLEKEMEHAEKYIALERFRFGDKMLVQTNVQEGIGNPQVVKFILQPLIENAIVHGLAGKRGYGSVLISVYRAGEELFYDVRDDGCGADPERIRQILEQKLVKKNSLEGFALENIQSRLRLRYGQAYGITYRKREEGGSIFVVRQPLIYEDEGRE